MFGTRADDDLFCVGMNSFVPSQMELEGFPQFEQPGVRGFLKNGTAVIVENLPDGSCKHRKRKCKGVGMV